MTTDKFLIYFYIYRQVEFLKNNDQDPFEPTVLQGFPAISLLHF